MRRFSIVVAADEASGIGKDGQLPWRLAGDMAYFKKLTTEPPDSGRRNAVIMGRKTWDSIPARFRPLPERINVVISNNTALPLPDGVIRAGSLDHALQAVDEIAAVGRIFVIGGGEIFRQAIAHPRLESVYLTRVHTTLECDTFFPPMPAGLRLVSQSEKHREGPFTYDFCRFE